MKRGFFGALALLWTSAALAIGPNGVVGALTVQNANGNTGACTASSCAVSVLQLTSGTIFSSSWSAQNTASFQVAGTWSGTITFQYSQDEGATWNNLAVFPLLNGVPVYGAGTTSTTANGNWVAGVGGLTTVRAVMSTYSSGTANVTMEEYSANPLEVSGANVTSSQWLSVSGLAQVKPTQGSLLSVHAQNTTGSVACLQVWCQPDSGITIGTTPPLALGLAANGVVDATFPAGACAAGTGITLAGTTTCDGGTGAAISVGVTYQ